MGQFKADLYEKLFEEWDDPVMEEHRRDEVKMIESVKKAGKKTFIDLGAGYGRVLSELIQTARNVIAIEIDKSMFDELNKRSKKFNNILVIKGDMTNLTRLLSKLDVQDPVMLLLENTLATVVGDWKKVLLEIKEVMNKYNGEVIISLYRQQALKDWGIKSYWQGVEMNGEPDLEKTNFEKGLFVSKTGYTSKWWTDKEIEDMKKFFGGELLNEIITDHYWIFHTKKGGV